MATGFLVELWQSVRLDILAQYRDAVIIANLLAITAMLQAFFWVLGVIHVDSELLSVLRFLHKWGTVVVFGTFMITIVGRSLVVVSNAFRRSNGSTGILL